MLGTAIFRENFGFPEKKSSRTDCNAVPEFFVDLNVTKVKKKLFLIDKLIKVCQQYMIFIKNKW